MIYNSTESRDAAGYCSMEFLTPSSVKLQELISNTSQFEGVEEIKQIIEKKQTMKKLLLSLLLLTFSVLSFAQKKDVLSIFMKDGTSVYFLLKEKPLITFENTDVKVVSSTDEAVLERSQVDHFEFVNETPTAIEDVEEELDREKFELTRNAIHLSGLTPSCKVQLFSIGGQSILVTSANENGAVTISIDSLQAGIYLVNYNEITIKFIKQ